MFPRLHPIDFLKIWGARVPKLLSEKSEKIQEKGDKKWA